MTDNRRVYLWVALGAVLSRLLYFWEHAGSAFFWVPVLDGTYYDSAARALTDGLDLGSFATGFRPLLYPLFLAAFYTMAGDWGLTAALAAQHLLGVATAVLVAALAIRLFRRPAAGALAGALYVLAGPPLFFEGEVLITSLFTFLGALFLWLLARAEAHPSPSPWVWGAAAGLVLGLAGQARANATIFLAALPLALWPREGRRRRALLVSCLALGWLGVQLAFALGQWPLLGRFQLLPGAGGVNLYLGNERGADGRVPRQDRPVTYGAEYRDSVEVFSQEVYLEAMAREGREGHGVVEPEPPDPGAVSRYWLGRTFEEIRADPGRWLALMAKKAGYLLWNRELPNNKTYAFVLEHESRLLGFLPVRWWCLMALAPLGFWWALHRGDRRLLFWIAAFLATHALGVLLFFVNARYRLPLWPGMAVLAGGGILFLAQSLAGQRWRHLGLASGVAVLLAALSLANLTATPTDSFARDFFFRSIARLEIGDLPGALADAETSVELDPSDPAARFQLGNAALALGDDARALAAFAALARERPGEPRIWNNLGIVLERLGRTAEACSAHERGLGAEADYAPALVNAGLCELRAGRLARAEELFGRAGILGYDSLPLRVGRAALAARQGRGEEAHRLLEEAKLDDPETTERLFEELR